ncbi:MAG: helicase RepA family protein [Methylocystis sp.]
MSERREAFDNYSHNGWAEEPASFARDFDERIYIEEPSQPSRKMRLEWFNTASALALSEPNNPLIADMLDEGALSVIYGESNSGKTFVSLDMGMAVAAWIAWNGKATKRGLVIYIAAEGGKRIQRRLAALRKRYHAEHGDDAPEPLLALVRFPIDLRSNDGNLKDLLALIRDAEAETGEKCVWIVVDTLSRALAGGDENSPVDMGRIVVAADRIRAETGAHFTYVHHIGKDAARGARGHSLLRAATDTEIEVTAGAIKVTKQRDMDSGQEYGFTLTDIYIGDDPEGQPVRSAVVDWTDSPPAKSAERVKSIPAQQRLFMDTVAQVIDEAGEMFRPFADGPLIKVVSDEIVRERYYARIAEKPRDGDTPERLAERRRKAFNNAINNNLNAKRLLAAEKDGERVLWLA